MITNEQLKAIRDRCNRATPGPWYAHATDDDMCMCAEYVGTVPCEFAHDQKAGFNVDPDTVIAITLLQSPPYCTADIHEHNTRFIANARTDIPALLYEIDRLREELRDAR